MTNAIAETIRQQLGGRRFAAMTGAKHFVALSRGLVVHFPAAGPRGARVNQMAVQLNAADLYDVTFCHQVGVNNTVRGEFENVAADRLQALFTEATGLDTHL